MIISSASDYREAARRKLPRFLFDYIDGGANAEHTMRANGSDLANISLRQRILRNVDNLSLKTTLFGQELALPAHIQERAQRFLDWLARFPFEPSSACPHCGSSALIAHGYGNGLPRWATAVTPTLSNTPATAPMAITSPASTITLTVVPK